MYQVIIEDIFYASHRLKMADGSYEPLHWHHWKVEVCIESDKLDKQGFVIDFIVLKDMLQQSICDFQGQQLEMLAVFEGKNASAEAVAETIYHRISRLLPNGVHCGCVEVTEAAGCRARFIPPQ